MDVRAFFAFASLPFLGVLFIDSQKKITRKTVFLSGRRNSSRRFCISAGLLFWDFFSLSHDSPKHVHSIYSITSLKFTFYNLKLCFSPLQNLFPPHLMKNKPGCYSRNEQTSLSIKPNIYIFVIESFREDFLEQEWRLTCLLSNKHVPIETTHQRQRYAPFLVFSFFILNFHTIGILFSKMVGHLEVRLFLS